MASELYVETLKGLTSGANANKVIVPAGQTLDTSAGDLVRAYASNEVIQSSGTVFYRTQISHNSTTPTQILTLPQITLTQANARIRLVLCMKWFKYNNHNGHAGAWLSINGAPEYNETFDGVTSPVLSQGALMSIRLANDGTAQSWNAIQHSGVFETTISNNAGDTLNANIKVWLTGTSGGIMYINRAPNQSTGRHENGQGCSARIEEIAG